MRQANAGKIAGVLGFGIDANRPSRCRALRLGQREDLVKGRDFELPVIGHIVLAQLRQAFLGAQGLELGQREIFGKPARHFLAINGLGGFAVGKFGLVRNVGGFRNLILMPRDQYAVLGQDKVWLNKIGTLVNCTAIACNGVFGPFTRGTTVRDDNDVAFERFFHGLAFRNGERRQEDCSDQKQVQVSHNGSMPARRFTSATKAHPILLL